MASASGFEPESIRVTSRLRAEIIDGIRQPGGKLVERELAEELGVSRVPVRDALKTLVAEGLVTARPRSWAVVREFTASDIADLDEVRSALEVLTFRLAAQRHSREGLARLRADLDVELGAARAGNPGAAHRAAADFHERVTQLAGNELLSELEGVMGSRLRWLLGQHDDLLHVAQEHEALFAAISDRDADRVESLVLQHLDSSRQLARSRSRSGAGARGRGGAGHEWYTIIP